MPINAYTGIMSMKDDSIVFTVRDSYTVNISPSDLHGEYSSNVDPHSDEYCFGQLYFAISPSVKFVPDDPTLMLVDHDSMTPFLPDGVLDGLHEHGIDVSLFKYVR